MLFRKGLNKIKPYEPGKPIEEVKRALGLKEVYKLASNEIPFVPVYIRKAIYEEINNINRYPEGSSFYLRRSLASKLKVKESQIVFGNGSDELITLALRATIENKDEVIIGYPTFLVYEIQSAVFGAKIIRVPLSNLRYDLEAMASKVTKKTKIIFVANPDNPTGTYVAQKEVEEFLKSIPKTILVVFDEAYFEFAPSDFPNTFDFLKKRGNIIITRTFSKVYGLAGLRIGYAITTEAIANVLNKIREPFNINRFAQVAALAAIKNDKFLKNTRSYILNEKKYLYKELRRLNVSFKESATNFVLIDFKKDANKFNSYLLKKGIIVRPLSGWGLKNYFRVTVGLHKENEKFIRCFENYLNTED
ncbi:MAG: histidinol-phosphate transaminase [Candidatus Omnitrophica bacterium]|jgi:histidinol-phosphate aminotransferase|nr:histidinol-phosphate transaminase [Candidatus Omnitrophota bacterium]